MMFDTIKSYLTVRNAIYFFSLIAGWPCVFYLMGWLPNYKINYIILLIVAAIYCAVRPLPDVPSKIKNLILFQIICWFIYSVIHNDFSYFTRIFLLIITLFILKMQIEDKGKGFINLYDGWLSLQTICGTVGMLLVLIGFLTPLSIFREMDGRPGYFFGLFTTNTYFSTLVRNAGFYDEPGALACWGMYALLLNKLFINNRKIEYLLIIGLISTLSMAYFIQISLYLLVFYRKKTWKLVIIITLFVLCLKLIASYNTEMNEAIFGRFNYNNETGTIAGDNRTELMERCWDIFSDYPILGIGASKLASAEIGSKYGFVGANFFVNWASDGFIGFIIAYLPLFYILGLGRLNPKFYGVAIILFTGFLQRPYDSAQLLFPLMIYTMLMAGYLNSFESFEEHS